MDEKICLDSDFAIELINNEDKANKFFDEYPSSEICTTTVNIFELFLRIENLDKIEGFLNNINILDFDKRSAIKASEIHKYLKNVGKSIEFRDVFVAATCIVNDCRLATLNKKHFNRIKELELI